MGRKHDAELPAGRWLKRLLLQLAAQALADAERLHTETDHATHRLRVRMKKADALLRLGRAAIPKPVWKLVRQHLKNAKNACAGQRDAAVLAELASDIAREHHLKGVLPKAAIQPPDPDQVRKTLKRLKADLEALTLDELSWGQVMESHADIYGSAKEHMDLAEETDYAEAFHDCRKFVKALHHQTLALSAWLPKVKKRLKRTRKLGKLLGQHHDLAVLELQPAVQTTDGGWKKIIAHEHARLREQILELAAKLFDESAEHFARTDEPPR